ncbi:MAG: 9-O-acetylesterase, partial [Abditibacteriaceae bacterium]
MKSIGLLVLFCLGFAGRFPGSASAAVRLPHVFGDGMVLQRDKPIPVWGWADPGEKVTVRFAGEEKSCVAGTDGRWMLKLSPLPAEDTPLTLSVSGADTQILKKDVLVGDVWLCSGDFGVYYELFASANAATEIANSDYPSMRLLKVASATGNAPLQDIQGQWMRCSPTTVNSFSALAYFFGRALHRELKVPIGLIDCSYRYSYLRSWIAPEGFHMIPELKEARDKMDSWDSTTEVGQQSFAAAIGQVEDWLPQAEEAFRQGKAFPLQPLMPAPTTGREEFYQTIGELSSAYNGMVAPLIPFAIRGVVWSQGENGGEVEIRHAYMQGLIGGWRKLWGQGDFP